MQLPFNQFLLKASDHAWFNQHSVIYFTGSSSESPTLFFSLLHTMLKAKGLKVESLSIEKTQEALFRSKLHTTFLGMTSYFWLQNSQMTEKEYSFLMHELSSYEGPNTVALYVPDTFSIIAHAKHCVVSVPAQIDQKMFAQCAQLFDKKMSNASIAKLFLSNPTFSLDSMCVMMQYLSVLGTHIDPFIDEWMPKIVKPENSLFTLSTHFFGKKSKPFFELWNKMGSEYADVFWLTYWSEQLWRAYHFVDLTGKRQHNDAKKMSMRLPFSFMQRDWRQFSTTELKNAHNDIYALDYNLKNGGSVVGLQLFYSKFFSGEFK